MNFYFRLTLKEVVLFLKAGNFFVKQYSILENSTSQILALPLQ